MPSIYNNTSYIRRGINLSSFDFHFPPPSPARITWSVLLGVIGVITLATNFLTIAAFSQKRLRRPPHYLLISLACADFMVASISIPINICINLGIAKLTLRSRAAFWFCDFLSGMASIFTLASISLERLFAMGWPLHHRIISPLIYAGFISIPWFLALIVSSMPLLDMLRLLPDHFMFHVVLASCCVTIVVTAVAYVTLWFRVLDSDIPIHERRREKDKRLAITLAIATVIFVFTWLPYPIILSIINLSFAKCVFPNIKLFNDLTLVCKFMHLANSFLNPLVYILRISEFRAAIRGLFCHNRPIRRIGVIPLENATAKNQATQASSIASTHNN